MDRVKGRVVIVTGGAHGIGHTTCMLLAKEGAYVAVTDVLDEEGQKTVEAIKSASGTAQFWHLDVSKEREVENVFAAVVSRFGKIDILVNNAGIAGADKPTHEVTEKEWDNVIGVNVISPEMFEFLPAALVPEILERIKSHARKRMDELVRETSFNGVPHEDFLEQGEIWETLKESAARHSIDVIALGTHGRRGLQKLLMGAVAEEILRLAHGQF